MKKNTKKLHRDRHSSNPLPKRNVMAMIQKTKVTVKNNFNIQNNIPVIDKVNSLIPKQEPFKRTKPFFARTVRSSRSRPKQHLHLPMKFLAVRT